MPTRLALLVATMGLIAAACGAATPAATPSAIPSPGSVDPQPTAQPAGDVDGAQEGRPELAIARIGSDTLEVTVSDARAKAWRIAIAGTADTDRLELVVEIGDIVPGIRVDEIVGGEVIASDDLTRFPDEPSVAAGGCHSTIGVCFTSDGITVDEATGTLSATFRFRDPSHPFAITGSTATWPAEPFILSDWNESQTYRSWE